MNEKNGAKSDTCKTRDEVNLHGSFKNGHGSETMNGSWSKHEDFEETPIVIAVMTYIAYALLILFGYLRDFMRYYGLEKSRAFTEKGNKVGN